LHNNINTMKNIKQDLDLLTEAYELVQEGLLQRIRSRGAQKVAGAKEALKGKAATGLGKLVSKVAPTTGASITKEGEKRLKKAGAVGEEAGYKSYLKSSAKSIAKDLAKLGMEVADEAALVADIQAAIVKNLKKANKAGQIRTKQGTWTHKL
jgi:hypothetical protein